ncbi:MAG: CoB--CoM heterodisulfide reductase iron-sulfur subunit A family protein [Bryobacteraceae bacterium]|nr:CoB--CoM heterodisulfide reductase iron-sulfur subunit A family protein [Bryobacteraceae bacterium]
MSETVQAGDHKASVDGDQPRVGVFVCRCGGNISDIVDVDAVARRLSDVRGVVCATTHQFFCSDPGQALIEQSIKEHNLDRVVVAACSPSLHEITFRRAVARAGLNQYLFEHANIREQVSWVITDKSAATDKAERLVRAAVARTRRLAPLQKRRIHIRPSVLVIGGGVAGLTAARDLAARGIHVTLIESSPFLGGRLAQLHRIFPTGQRARDVVTPLIEEVASNPNIVIHTNAELERASGFIGDFHTVVRIMPRGVSEACTNPQEVIDSCPEETVDGFNLGLAKRKAIYMPYAGCYPPVPAIDWRSCTKCGACFEAAAGKGIDLDEKPREVMIAAGAIVIAAGLNTYAPRHGEYGYGQFQEVVTLAQLNRMLDPTGPTAGKLTVNGRSVRRVGFMHCVGSLQHEGIHKPMRDGRINQYCSRVCCTTTMHAAEEIKDRFPGVQVYDFHEDIRTYGRRHESYYDHVCQQGVAFIRFDPLRPPTVEADTKGEFPLVVKTTDRLTFGEELEVPLDLLVLATGLVARDMSKLVDLYRCSVGADRFLLEVHPKLRPVELAAFGLFLAGSVQGPMDIAESTAAAAAAASKASALIKAGQIELDPFVARVDEHHCSGCKVCLYVCPFTAIERNDSTKTARVNEALCTGCGTCVASCPCNAIQQQGFEDSQVESELMALLAGKPPAEELLAAV